MLTPIRLLADPDALPPSPPSDLAWLRTCGAAGIEKEGKNCERRRGPEKWDDLFFYARCTAGTKPREVVRIHLYAFRIALSTY